MNGKIFFPKNFLWGATSSAHQNEGKGNIDRGLTVWEMLYKQNPNDFYNGIDASLTSDFINKYEDDLKLAKKINLNAYQTSFSWARLFPDGNKVNQKAVKYYHKMIDKAQELEIKITMNIYHFDLPKWAALKGGFANKEVVDKYVEYGKFILQEFGNKVDYILTNVEPSIPVFAGYQHNGKLHYPGIIDNDLYIQNWWGLILGHSKLCNYYNKELKQKIKATLGVSLIVSPTYPKDNFDYTNQDKIASKQTSLFRNKMWILPMVNGEIPEEIFLICQKYKINWNYTMEEINEIKKTKIDFLGLNYYKPSRVKARENTTKNINEIGIYNFFGENYKWKNGRFSAFEGWEIHPEGLYDAMMFVKHELGNISFVIAENGIGIENEEKYRDSKTKIINDDYRIAFVSEHLEQVSKAIKNGANCKGYYMSALTDNWSWKNTYKNRYGFIEINLKNQSRTIKKSGYWIRDVIVNSSFSKGFLKTEEVIKFMKAKYTDSKK